MSPLGAARSPGLGAGAARRLLAGAVALAVATGCGGGPAPGPDLEAEGRVVLPTGSPLSLGDLTASGPFGSEGIAADGSFTTPMARGGLGLVLITAPAGDLVLMGFLDTTESGGVVSGASTAAALLYLALGGPFMPGDAAHVLELVASDPSMPALAAVVTSTLAAEPLALARGDEALVDAVLAARDAIAARNNVAARDEVAARDNVAARDEVATLALGAARYTSHAVEGSGNVIVTDAGQRGGFDLLIAEDGLGVLAQNTLRRPARLLVYQTGVKSQHGDVHQFTTGQLIGEPVTVPPTRSLNLFLALEDALGGSGGSAFAPVESDSVTLPLLDGSTRTYYTTVLLAPSLVPGAMPPVFTDSRFFPYRSQWDAIIDDLHYETWWTSLLFPLMSSMAFGMTSQVAYASLAEHAPAVRAASEPVLAAKGIANPMTGDRAKAMIAAIEEAALGADTTYFWELIEHTRTALGVPDVPQSSLLNARAYMSSLAKAAGVLAIVDALLAGVDISAMLYDMAGNGPAEAYNPVRLQTRAEIHPEEGQVQRLVAPSQVFNVVIDEPLDGGRYLYRWSTSGEYGFISDYLQEGASFDTTSDEVFYLANEPAVITPELFDDIMVEVYLDDGSGVIGAGAEAVTVANATVVGKERRELIMGRFLMAEESYESGGQPRNCASAYVAFERQPDAVTYSVNAFNFYDPFYYYGHYGTTVYEKTDWDVISAPCDSSHELLVGNEVYLFLSGGHGPNPPNADGWFTQRFDGMLVEVMVTY